MHLRQRPTALPVLILVLIGLTTGPVAARPVAPAPDAPAATAAFASTWVNISLVTGGLASPVGVVNAGDGTGRLFVVEQRGTVRVVSGSGSLVSGFFLDIRGSISSGGERGLLGLAFHPSFETNRKLFVYYTNPGGDLIIAEMTANGAGTSAGSLDPILTIEHSANTNHNGGQLLYGPDNYLYVFTGDGGGGGDPDENGQDINSLLGKTLRIGPNLSGGYSNPGGNPYFGATAGRDEIWSIGLRNPWKASFDRDTGTLWIADVGQENWEEVNREPAGTPGRNYGWDCREGKHTFEGGCTGLTLTDPVVEYGHPGGNCSVTGGFVYRGDVFEEFRGRYVLGDYCSGRMWTLVAGAGSPTLAFSRDTAALISSFGESESGEIYMTDHAGRLYRVVAPPFSDVASSDFIDDIVWLYYADITGGCGSGKYCPNGTVTRGEMAAFLARALNLPGTGQDFFTDDNNSPFEASINQVAAAEIAFGCAPNRYCPDGTVTREQMASFLVRGFDLPPTGSDFFTDDETSVHEADINRLAASGITGGCNVGIYCPKQSVTRGQMAAFLHRGLTD